MIGCPREMKNRDNDWLPVPEAQGERYMQERKKSAGVQ